MHVPLYIKTHNSLLQSLIKIDDLIDFAKQNNIKVLTITDNNMFGALEFYNKCLQNDIKPIIGLEVNDIVLYAQNYQGYKNLIKLSTIMSEREVLLEDLIKYKSDLICILLYKSKDKYDELAKHFNYIFQGYSNLDEKLNLKGNLIYLNEILYLDEKDKPYLKYLYAIKDGISIDSVNIDKTDNHFFAYKLYTDENNNKINELCNLQIPKHQDLLPIYDTKGIDSYTYLKQLTKEGLKRIFGEKAPKIYLERLKYELDVINKMGFCNYFLVVWDYVNFAKQNKILTGPGRGSAAGSLVSYCLGITSVDPIKYNLLFERFLNPDRVTMPDIDIDFEYNRREEVIEYCINKYGKKKATPIITFGTLGAKQAVRDVARCMKIDLKMVDKVCKLIDSNKTLKENLKENNKLQEILTNDLKKMYQIAIKFEGLKRHTSIHAAGIVISNTDLDEVIPLTYHDSFYTTGYSMEYLEELGLLKMDILALKNLTLLNDVSKEVNVDIDSIPLNDLKTIKVFTDVDTIGIFQFESDGMMNFLRKFKPNCFEDIVAAIALFRPGPMNNIDTYIKRKQGLEKIDYIDERLINILKPTYGIIIYQEQIMQIANILAGYTLAEADVLRKAMSKKQEQVLLQEKDKFINQSIKNGLTKEKATEVYNLILKFASYGFNRAHSVAYSMIAYKMAYLKTHFPNVFIKHLLNSVIGSEIKTKEYIYTARTKGIKINKPDINKSKLVYNIVDDTIYYPLTNIKNIGENIAKEIVSKGPYKDIFDFISKTKVSTSVLQTLIKADCFSSFNLNQKTLDSNIDTIINYSELGDLLNEEDFKPVLVNNSNYDVKELLKRELQVFGFYLNNHPLSQYRKNYPIKIKDIDKYFNKTIDIIVCTDRKKQITTKKNEKMLFITGSDEEDILDIVLFPKIYQDIDLDSIYLFRGKVEKRFDKYQLIVNNLKKME